MDKLKSFMESATHLGETSELDLYLEAKRSSFDDDLDVLSWWRTEGKKYPTLSKVAKDLLAIPVSTVTSKSVFSTSGRLVSQILRGDEFLAFFRGSHTGFILGFETKGKEFFKVKNQELLATKGKCKAVRHHHPRCISPPPFLGKNQDDFSLSSVSLPAPGSAMALVIIYINLSMGPIMVEEQSMKNPITSLSYTHVGTEFNARRSATARISAISSCRLLNIMIEQILCITSRACDRSSIPGQL
nr:zinc finger BED domain-containing protein DAYSLEEPER-like [Ipomoea batatas]